MHKDNIFFILKFEKENNTILKVSSLRTPFFQGNWKEVFILRERMTKKILAIFLTVAMCLTFMPVTAFADTKIENVNISEEGILTFDE